MLTKKMLRDIRRNKVQFMAIFLMMFVGCFLFSGITGEWRGLEEHFQTYIDEQNMADMWTYGDLTGRDIDKIRNDVRINEAEGRMVLPMVPAGNKESTLQCYMAQSSHISKLYVKKGIAYDSSKKGIWLDALYARENSYKVGGQIELDYKDMEIKGEILGLVYSPEYIYGASEGEMMPEHKNTGFAWISPKLLPAGVQLHYNEAAVITAGVQRKQIIQDILGEKEVKTIVRAEHPAISMVKDEIKQHQTIGTAFSAAFLLIAVMIVMTTMHRMLKNEKMQIGILKALGFTKKKLLLHYLSHNAFICLTGALGGFICGYRFLPGLIYKFMRQMYVIPVWGGYLPPVYYLLPLGCTVFCVLISFFICRRYLKPNAADILYTDMPFAGGKQFPGTMELLGFAGRWNLRDIARNRLRSFMSLCGVLGCTALLFCAFALYDTFVNLSDWTFTKQQNYECKITDLPEEKGQKELLAMTDGEYLMESSASILTGGTSGEGADRERGKKGEKEVALTVSESTRYLKLAENLDTFTAVDGGVALSKKTADSLGIRKGGFLTWKPAGGTSYICSEVKAIVRTPLSQGIIMQRSDYEAAGQVYKPTAVIGKEPANGFGTYEEQCSISHQRELVEGVDSMMDGMVMMIMLLVLGAVILGSVMLYNLGILSYMERYREFATMKVLGFADKKIRKIMIQQNVWLSALGILLGMPAGYGLLYYLLSTIPESMDVPVFIRAASWSLSAAGTLALSFVVSRVVSRKIPHINMVEALKQM